MSSASLHPSAAFAVSQQDAMAFGSEEATMGSWRKSVADLQVLFEDKYLEDETGTVRSRNMPEPMLSTVSFHLPPPDTFEGDEDEESGCCRGLRIWSPRTYEWITGRMSTTRKHLLVVAFMVLEGVKYLLAREAFVPGVNNLSILVVENLVSLADVSFPTSSLLAQKNAKICFLGLDNAGKTTLLQMLRDGRLGVNAPTLYPNQEELCIQGIRFRTFDLGGHETARRIWKDYLAAVDGIIFLVDAADRTRFAEASEEIGRLLEDPALARVPFAVLGNKIDIPVAASEDELRHALGLYTHMTSGKHVMGGKQEFTVRPLELFMCSVVKRMGYTEAFDWLAKLV
ncbi:GTP-binding protein SAR1A [Symbiodinium microadriaticum]|uniref:GTP-binding protein SAR1A n=2 Tax=Symbiodinium TaxID=2949 RepID=A0A1Q9D9P0_SYMMI|nr:GTP-binding protein SAR1A [Symbiodinium microadriaticum]